MSDDEVEPLQSSKEGRQTLWTPTLVASALACVIGSSFQVGYHTGVLNAPEQVFKDFYNETYYRRAGNETDYFPEDLMTFTWSLTVSIFCIGGMIGGLSGGVLSSRLGRKRLMLLNNALLITASVTMFLCEAASSYEMLIAGRAVTGFHAGLSTVVAPLYLSEIAPQQLKGTFGTLNQLAIVIGVLVAQVLGLRQLLGTHKAFTFLLVIPTVPAALQIATLPLCVESPYWLRMYKRDISQARNALSWLRGSQDVGVEMSLWSSENVDENRTRSRFAVADFCKRRYLRITLLAALGMQLSQQLCGINAVTYYSTSIFNTAGISGDYARYSTLGLGALMVAMTAVSSALVDRLGRRVLHITGLLGMLVSLTTLTVSFCMLARLQWMSYLTCAALAAYIIFFSLGPGSIPWFITAELFEHGTRPFAMAIANFANWSGNFLVGLLFPLMQKRLVEYAFVPFIALLFGFAVFTYFVVPETKNRTVEDIVATLKER